MKKTNSYCDKLNISGGKIQISRDTNEILKRHKGFTTIERGTVDIKASIYLNIKSIFEPRHA